MEEGIIDLDQVVNFYLDAWNLPDQQYRRISGIALRGLRFIHAHATANPVVVEVDVLPNGTADFPGGCLNIIRVSRDPSGREPMMEDPQLGLRDVDCDCHGGHDPSCGYYKYRDSYRLERQSRRVYLDHSMIGGSVYIEYIPLLQDNGKYIVDPLFVECLIEWCGWQDKTRNVGERKEARVEFFNHLRIGKRSNKPLVYAEIIRRFKRDYPVLYS